MKEQKLPSLEEIRKKFKPFRNVNVQHKSGLSRIDKAAIWITEHVGSMGFFMIIFCWTLVPRITDQIG